MTNKIAIVRVRGSIRTNKVILDTLEMMREFLGEELTKAEATRRQANFAEVDRRGKMNAIHRAFSPFNGLHGMVVSSDQKSWFIHWKGHEVARATIRNGQVSWSVSPPFSPPSDWHTPYVLGHLHHRCHVGDFKRFPEAMARVVAEIEVRQ